MCVVGHDVLAHDVTLACVGCDVVLADSVTCDVVLAVGGIFGLGDAVMMGGFTLAAVAFGLAGTDVSVGDAWGCAMMLADPVATDSAFAGGGTTDLAFAGGGCLNGNCVGIALGAGGLRGSGGCWFVSVFAILVCKYHTDRPTTIVVYGCHVVVVVEFSFGQIVAVQCLGDVSLPPC